MKKLKEKPKKVKKEKVEEIDLDNLS